MSARDDYPSLYEFASRDKGMIAKRADAWRALTEIDRLRAALSLVAETAVEALPNA